jgi:hypothetical protein
MMIGTCVSFRTGQLCTLNYAVKFLFKVMTICNKESEISVFGCARACFSFSIVDDADFGLLAMLY